MKEKKEIVKKMISDKKKIRDHVQSGGDIDDLPTEEFGFVQPI